MACGSCGGISAKSVQRRALSIQKTGQAKTQTAKSVSAAQMRPTSTTRIVATTPASAIKVKQQLKDLKSCPLCGSILSHVVAGSGVRNRKRCLHCNRTFI